MASVDTRNSILAVHRHPCLWPIDSDMYKDRLVIIPRMDLGIMTVLQMYYKPICQCIIQTNQRQSVICKYLHSGNDQLVDHYLLINWLINQFNEPGLTY